MKRKIVSEYYSYFFKNFKGNAIHWSAFSSKTNNKVPDRHTDFFLNFLKMHKVKKMKIGKKVI